MIFIIYDIFLLLKNKHVELSDRYRELRSSLKKKLLDVTISDEEYFCAQRKMSKLLRDYFYVRVRKTCRPRGVHGLFGVSRLQLHEMASNGEIPGMTKIPIWSLTRIARTYLRHGNVCCLILIC